MRQSDFKDLTNKLKTAINGKKFSHFSYGASYRLQEDKSDKAQAFNISYVQNNLIHVNFYELIDLQKNKLGYLAYKDSHNISSEYCRLTDKQVNAINDLFYNLHKLEKYYN